MASYGPGHLVIKIIKLEKNKDTLNQIIENNIELIKTAKENLDERPYFNIFIVDEFDPGLDQRFRKKFNIIFDKDHKNYSKFRDEGFIEEIYEKPICNKVTNGIITKDEFYAIQNMKLLR